jgi:hypothetical protein
MFKLASLALVALVAVTTVLGAPILPRHAGWNAEMSRSHGHHHHHSSDPANTPVVSPTPTTSPTPEPTVPGDDCDSEDDVDCDNGDDTDDGDCDDEPMSSPAPVPTYSSPIPSPAQPSPTEDTSSPSPSPVDDSTNPSPSPVDDTTTPTPSPTSDGNTGTTSTEVHSGGDATWFTQNGNYGACGDLHSDSDFIAALDYRTYGDSGVKSSYCGQKIRVSWQGKSVDVTVADDCPSCSGPSSVDLSVAAFQALAPLDVGDLSGISWSPI